MTRNRYECRFKYGALHIGRISLVFVATMSFWDVLVGEPIHLIVAGAVGGIAATIVSVPLLTILAIKCSPVFVSSEGLRAGTIYGPYKTISWDDIEKLRPMKLITLDYIKVYSRKAKYPIYVPGFLKDVDVFLEDLGQYCEQQQKFEAYFERLAEK